MSLSDQQRAAVEREGQDVCVVAGPGSGKTRVLVERFRWLVESRGVSPLRILAITFTEKAAHEIKARLVDTFQHEPSIRRSIERAYVSTLHAFCMRLLRENAIAAGVDPRFEILEERDARTMLRECAEQALDELFAGDPDGFRSLLSAWKTGDPAADLMAVYEALRAGGDSPPEVAGGPANQGLVDGLIASVREMRRASPRPASKAQQTRLDALDEWLARAEGLRARPVTPAHFEILESFDCDKRGLKAGHPIYDTVDTIKKEKIPAARAELASEMYGSHRRALLGTVSRFDGLYRQRKRALSALDFSDLEERAIALLRGDTGLRETVSSNFEAILMDELQDTNPLQWTLMDLLRRKGRFFAVGDINQSIFGFRRAEPRVFRGYRRRVEEEGGRIDQLTRNHRSREAILRAVDAVMDGAEGVEPNPLEAAREFVPAEAPSVEIIEAAPAAEDADPAALEAQWVARRIRELEGTLPVADKNTKGATRPARFSDIAVLVRNTRSLDNLEQAFRDFSVPFLMNRGRAFFDELEITDLVAWLRILANPRDEAALAAVLRSPFVGLSAEGLLRLRLAGGGLASGIREFEPSPEWPASDAEAVSRFLALFRELRALRDDWPPDRLLARAIDACGYEEGALPRERANIDKFLQLLRDWHSRRPRSCRELVERLEALREDTVEPSAPANDTPDAVQVLTVHAAKGLEFPVVFLAGMHLGMKVERPPLLYSRPHGLGVLWRNPGDGNSLPDLAHNLIWNEIREREAEEANRLLYVAMTRAEEHLVMSYAERKRRSPWTDLISRALPELVRRVDRPPERELPAREASVSPEPEALPAPRASGNYDSTASVSALLQFAACPRQYYLQRYLGWQPQAAPGAFALPSEDDEKADTELSPTELGTAVHAILAGDPPDAHPVEARDLAGRFTASPLGARAARAEWRERELDFVFALEGIVLRGQIDLWFGENGVSVLVDYKTDRYDAARAEHYAIQLQLYALALGGFTGRVPEEAWLCFLRAEEPVRVPVDEAALEGARELVRRFREAQNRLAFPLREGPHCFHCGFYRGLCPR